MKKLKIIINKIFQKIGYRFTKIYNKSALPFDMDKKFTDIYETCKPYTKTSKERMYAMYKATEYIEEASIQGAIVECGVWRGGSSMVGALYLSKNNINERDFYLYDTYKGMVEPTEKDVTLKRGAPAKDRWESGKRDGYNAWAYAPLDEVKKNMESTGYPGNKFNYIEGMVEDTILKISPKNIAILRLDTDWYKSTKHELVHLFPLISDGGVLIIDDYGCFKGAKDAVDEFIRENNVCILLHRVDSSGRVGIKT